MDHEELIIFPHAYKHGLTEEEIRFAWTHAYYRFDRLDSNRGDSIVVIGPTDEAGLFLDNLVFCAGVIGESKSGNLVAIYHASRPPVGSLLKELEQWRGTT